MLKRAFAIGLRLASLSEATSNNSFPPNFGTFITTDTPSFAQANVKADIQGQSDALTMELLFHFKPRDHRWRPYIIGGTGAKDYIVAGPEPFPQPIPEIASLTTNDVWKVVFSVGGGLKFRLMPHMLLRAEFLDYLTNLSPPADCSRSAQYGARSVPAFPPLFGVSYVF